MVDILYVKGVVGAENFSHIVPGEIGQVVVDRRDYATQLVGWLAQRPR